MSKPILCLDFDGVIHSYENKWIAAHVIPDPPVEGAFRFIVRACEDFRVAIFSSRSNQPGGIEAMKAWVNEWVVHPVYGVADYPDLVTFIEWPIEKPPAFVTIDDRAITFTGVWPDISTLLAFKPWNKK